MSEPLHVPDAIPQAVDTMLSGQPFHGIGYSNLQLYGGEFDEAVDPHCLVEREYVSTYWPGGIPEPNGKFSTMKFHRDEDKMPYGAIGEVRKQILGLQLSKRALRRWQDFRAHVTSQLGIETNEHTDLLVPDLCAQQEAPIGAILISRVERHNKIKTGRRIAHLYFPTVVSAPSFVLDILQAAQQKTIDEEQL